MIVCICILYVYTADVLNWQRFFRACVQDLMSTAELLCGAHKVLHTTSVYSFTIYPGSAPNSCRVSLVTMDVVRWCLHIRLTDSTLLKRWLCSLTNQSSIFHWLKSLTKFTPCICSWNCEEAYIALNISQKCSGHTGHASLGHFLCMLWNQFWDK